MHRLHLRLFGCVLAVCLLAAGCDDPVAPPEPEPVIDSPEAVVTALVRAYVQRDPDLLASLLANDSDHNAEFVFLLSEPSDRGETQWGFDEEARIHRRMFRPDQVSPGERPLPEEYWLRSLSISLTPKVSFSESPDLYSKDGGADGKLDPALWRASAASYTTNMFFDLAGDTDYAVQGVAKFAVLEDLQKNTGDPGKFLLFVWEDREPDPRLADSAPATWGNIKSLYR